MKRIIRKIAATCLFMGIVAGLLAPGFVGAHEISAEYEEIAKSNPGTRKPSGGANARPKPPKKLRIDRTHNAVVVSWNAGHGHAGSWWRNNRFLGHRLFVVPYRTGRSFSISSGCPDDFVGCIWRLVPLGSTGFRAGSSDHFVGARFSETVSGLTPSTSYFVGVTAIYNSRSGQEVPYGSSARVITTNAAPEPEPPTPPEPETPAPETPAPETPAPGTPGPETPGPETPGPETQTCTYKHRIIGIPGTTSGGYTGQILISSEEPNATATIRAYQADNGHPIDVLDSEGSAVGSTTSLAPAHSVKVFRLEGAQGWHSVIVEHPSARAMRHATVAMRIREPDVGVSFMPAQGIEHCEPVATTTE